MASGHRWRAGLTTIGLAVLASLVPVVPAPAATGSVSFVVIDDVTGLPVVRPYVLTWVMGGERLFVHQSRGGADGRVPVSVPDDASAVARRATGLPVNVMTLVTDRMPGTPGLKATAVTTALNASGLSDLPFDVAGVDGQVYTLYAGLVDFETFPPAETVGSLPPDEPECVLLDGPCHLIDWPLWVRDMWVPVADNLGAGKDMFATMDYESTARTTTTVAVGFGRSGFFEARGAHSYVKESSIGFGWGEVGHGENVQAILVTKFQRERAGVCWDDWIGGTGRHCALTTTYAPYEGIGPEVDPWPAANDTLDPVLDCANKVFDYWKDGRGTETGKSFALSLGPGENWATSVPFQESHFLHATSTVTGETTTGKSFVRRWTVDRDDKQFKHHWVMVKGGKAAYNRVVAGGGPTCPETAVQDVYTHAANDDVTDPKSAAEPPQPQAGVPCDPTAAPNGTEGSATDVTASGPQPASTPAPVPTTGSATAVTQGAEVASSVERPCV